jgi:hypothetical protein
MRISSEPAVGRDGNADELWRTLLNSNELFIADSNTE